MLQDFPGVPAKPQPQAPPASGPDPALPRLRNLWWAVPGLFLALDVFYSVWNLAVLPMAYQGDPGSLRFLLMWVPFGVGLAAVAGAAALLALGRAWPNSVWAGFAAGMAIPFVGLVAGRLLPALGPVSPALALSLAVRPGLGVLLAAYALTLRRNGDPVTRAGGFAVAVLAAVAGGWIIWALLPGMAWLLGDAFAEEAADPAAPAGEPSAVSLRTAGFAGLLCAFAATVVPVLGLIRLHGGRGAFVLAEGLVLVAACLLWNILGARWARGRSDGRVLRILAWILLALPLLLAGLAVVLLLIFKPRLF